MRLIQIEFITFLFQMMFMHALPTILLIDVTCQFGCNRKNNNNPGMVLQKAHTMPALISLWC